MARKKAAKLTANQQAWKKEQNRIKRFIKRAEKRGFSFDEFQMPSMPSRVTKKSVEKMRGLNAKTLYEKGTYVSPLTGEYMSGSEGRSHERHIAAQRAAATRARKAEYPNADWDDQTEQAYQDYLERTDRTEPADVSIISALKDEIANLPDVKYYKHSAYEDYSDRKNILSSILDDRLEIAAEHNSVKDYIDHLKEVQSVILHDFEVIKYDSDQGRVEASFSHVAAAFSYDHPLSMEELQEVEELNEYYENFNQV